MPAPYITAEVISPVDPVLLVLGGLALLFAGALLASVLRGRPTWFDTFVCSARQYLRRWSWFLLFVPGILSYPLQMDALVRYLLRHVPKGDYAQALDAAYAKLVDPLFFYSKVSIAVGMFCLVNWLAWAALNMAIPVLPDWAKGWYKQPRADYGVRPGFKGTFLGDGVSDTMRLVLFFVGLGLELHVGEECVKAAFQIQ